MQYLKILGNVSPYPTKNNNCPGYMIVDSDIKILLDCGPGVCKELNILEDLDNLNIFISHFHKDHYSDVFAIAYASYVYHNLGILNTRIDLYIPRIDINDSSYNDYILIKNMKEHFFNIIEYDKNDIFNINNLKISFEKNYHSVLTYSTKIESDKLSIIYAADLGYNETENLINFYKDADYLIIESTFLESDKKSLYHLSAKEAALIAKSSNVKRLLLTHFWPEYDNWVYLEEAKKVFFNTDIAKQDDIIYF